MPITLSMCGSMPAGVHHGPLEPGRSPADLDSPSPEVGQPMSTVNRQDILAVMPSTWPAHAALRGPGAAPAVFGHGFLTREARRGWVNHGQCLIQPSLLGALRPRRRALVICCCRHHLCDDGDFQQQRFLDSVNNDLAYTIGNLLKPHPPLPWPRRWFDNAVLPSGWIQCRPSLGGGGATARELVACLAWKRLGLPVSREPRATGDRR